MPRIDPIAPEDLEPDIADLIEVAQASGAVREDTTVPRLWARRPELARAQLPLHTRYHDSNLLDARLLELARLRIAAINDCTACKVARKTDDVSEEDIACLSSEDRRFSERERMAIRFAELFAADHFAIDDDLMARMGERFTADELVELAMYCGLMLGGGRFAHVMRGWEGDEGPVVVGASSAAR
jgi:alkylhydroperoxidase family enzyme